MSFRRFASWRGSRFRTLSRTIPSSDIEKTKGKGHPAISYKGNAQTIRTRTHRLIVHKNGEFELYDHRTPNAETKNLAKNQRKIVTQLNKTLSARLNTAN